MGLLARYGYGCASFLPVVLFESIPLVLGSSLCTATETVSYFCFPVREQISIFVRLALYGYGWCVSSPCFPVYDKSFMWGSSLGMATVAVPHIPLFLSKNRPLLLSFLILYVYGGRVSSCFPV